SVTHSITRRKHVNYEVDSALRRWRARKAEIVPTTYKSAKSEKPVSRENFCETQPSTKLIRICTMVVTMAIADCVRPMKWRGTMAISEACATTPDKARQKPKRI